MEVSISGSSHPETFKITGYSATERMDRAFRRICRHVIKYGSLDKDPRPHWLEKDGSKTKAHSYSINNVTMSFNIPDGDFPVTTVRRTAWWTGNMEIEWIYNQASNDLVVFDQLIKRCTWEEDHKINNWWEPWALRNKETKEYILNKLGHPNIGSCYGGTVSRYDLMHKLLDGIKTSPDSRRHIISLWQDQDFVNPDDFGLTPCVHKTQFIVRHERCGVDYLDASVDIRSWDFITAGAINLTQYVYFATKVARHCGYPLGSVRFSIGNLQIYDRHIKVARKLCRRTSIPMNPRFVFNTEETDFFKIPASAVKLQGYDGKLVDAKNPQVSMPIAI